MSTTRLDLILELAQVGISNYLDDALKKDRIDQQLYEEARKHTFSNLISWMEDGHIDIISPRLKEGVRNAIIDKRTLSISGGDLRNSSRID